MSLDFAQNRDFFVLDGNVLTSGGSLNVHNGTLAIVDNDPKSVTQNGRKVVSSFAGLSKDKDFQILLGKIDSPVTRSTTNKPYESLPFKLSEIESLKVVAPQEKGIKVDDFIIGYNGKNGTEITLGERTETHIDITLWGDPIAHLGYKEGMVTVKLYLEHPYVDEDGVCVDCTNGVFSMQEIVEKAVERFNNMTLLGGEPITNYVEAIPVNSLNAALTDTIPYTYFNLTLTDLGTQTALARVQAQYPTYKVVLSDRVGDERSVYTILAPTGTTLTAYTTSLAQLLKGCEDCPAGYTELPAGTVYSVTLEDDGVDATTTVDDVPGFVTGTAVKIGLSQDGVGSYMVVVDNELTDAEIATFKGTNALKSTARFDLLGDVKALCENNTTTTTAWVAGDECDAVSQTYTITLADDECGDDRLAELQAAYPDLTIIIATENQSQTATLTGTSGTANVNIGGVNYLATFATDLATTVANFITAHKAAIETANPDAVIVGSGATLVLTAPTGELPSPFTVTNATGNLAGTVAAPVASGAQLAELCQTTYSTDVITNIVCEECDPAFRELFIAESPRNYGVHPWETEEDAYNPAAKMGIRFRGKEFILSGTEEYRDDMPFYATSTRISVAGGMQNFVSESWEQVEQPFKVKILSIASEPEALGGHLWEREDQSNFYFSGMPRLEGNNYGKFLWGMETRLKGLQNYVQYSLTVFPKKYYQYTPHSSEKICYNVIVELGRHEAVENLLNALASSAGLPSVRAYSK